MAVLTDFAAGFLIIIVSVVGFTGNSFTWVAATTQKLYERPIYFLILSLASSDLICNVIQIVQDGPSIMSHNLTISGMWNRALGWLLVHCFQLHVTQAIFIIIIQAICLYRKNLGDKFLTKRNVTICVICLWLFPLWQTMFLLPFSPFSELSSMSFVAETRSWFVNFTYPASNPINQASGVYLIFCFIIGCLSSILILYKIWVTRNQLFDVNTVSHSVYETKRLSA